MAKIIKIWLIFAGLFYALNLNANELDELKKANELHVIATQKISDGVQISFNRAVKNSEISQNTASVDITMSAKFNTKKYGDIKIYKASPQILRIDFNKAEKITINKKENILNFTSKTASKNTTKSAKNSEITEPIPLKSTSKNKIIVIDAGHGGKDSGAVSGKLQEKIIVAQIAKKVGINLKKRGYKVFYTRSKDVFVNLRTRTAMANQAKADIFVSIHANAAPSKSSASKMQGIETYFLSPSRSERSKKVAALENNGDIGDMNQFSKQTFLNFLNREKIVAANKLAIDVQKYMLDSVQKKFSANDGGVREAPFWVLVGATMPSILIEVGYITHPQEGPNIADDKYQNALAKGISDGIVAYFAKNPI